MCGLMLVAGAAARAEARTVLVFPFENLSNDRSLDWLGEGIAELIVEKLQFEPGMYVFSRDERLDAYEKLSIPEMAVVSRATELKLGWESGADKIIAGRFSGTAETFKISAHRGYGTLGCFRRGERARQASGHHRSDCGPGNQDEYRRWNHFPFPERVRKLHSWDAEHGSYEAGFISRDGGSAGSPIRVGNFRLGHVYHLERDSRIPISGWKR